MKLEGGSHTSWRTGIRVKSGRCAGKEALQRRQIPLGARHRKVEKKGNRRRQHGGAVVHSRQAWGGDERK